MDSEEERRYWEEFIETYKENPCLWNTKSEDYNNSSKRNIAYGLLIEKLWEIDGNADKHTVEEKINSFKSLLGEEVNKIKQCKENGHNYIPTWCYYKSLSFLTPYEDGNVSVICSNNKNETITEITSSTEQPQGIVASKDENVASESSKQAPVKKRKLSSGGLDWEDDCSTFAAHVKTRMRSFDPLQKCIAQKLISDVMFFAETKQLQPSSSISNLSD